MSKKEVLVEYVSKVNSAIKQALHQTQRIKFTCYDLSSSYIVFGATSGGIYIFSRYPCKFIKLIPTKDGAVTNVVISPDQKIIALSTNKGLIVIVENCFSDSNIQYQMYSQHEGNLIMAMIWCLNDLYCGDNTGHVSVISFTNLLTKALFQIPSATLMRLDSSVVQLDVYSNFLLVSTKTRTYICDTVHEQYRQIGKKLRDGNFGACFYITQNEETTTSKSEGATCVNTDSVKLYCARPGSRLWEASFEACVLCTHQFRDSMDKSTTSIIHLDENTNSSLLLSSTKANVPSNFNFEKIFMFNGYILTFRADGIYIFDVETVSLLYWTNYFNNIKDIKILKNIIYIWLENNIMKILTLLDIESFVLKLLSRKQYLLCAQFCVNWMDDITALVDHNRLQVLKVLNEKVLDEKLAQCIEPLLKKVENCKISSQKLENGIYIIDNLHSSDNIITANDGLIKLRSNIQEMKSHASSNSDPDMKNGTADPYLDKNYLINTLNTQYQLHKINKSVHIPKFLELMQSKSLEELKTLYDLFLEYSQNKNDSQQWITCEVLKCINSDVSKYFDDLPNDSNLFQFIFDRFVSLNKSDDLCSCLYPLPTASQTTVQYYAIGCEIMNSLLDYIALCKVVPAMYRYTLEKKNNEQVILVLPLLIQYSDIDLFNKYCTKFTYDLWDQALSYLIKLKSNKCLNCDKDLKNTSSLNWNDFAKCMLCSMGGSTTLKLLSRYSRHIPPGQFDMHFYQSCIFINCVSNSGNESKTKCISFMEDICKNETSQTEFDLLIMKYLKTKQNGNCKRTNINTSSTDSSCSVCDISLNSTLFEDNVKLKCGHFSHSICAVNRETCNSCYINKF